MESSKYRCECYTCGLDRLYDTFKRAQTEFNVHADNQHQIELIRITGERERGELEGRESTGSEEMGLEGSEPKGARTD